MTVWLQSPLAKNLVAECARLDQAAAVWHGPDLQIPTGSEQVGKSPDRTDTFLSSFLRFELLPADSRGRLPTPAAKLPLLVQLSAPDRIDAAKAAARQETSTFLLEDGSFLPVGYQLKPAWPRVDLNLLSDRANAVARSFLARRHPSLSGGGMVDYRYDGRLDRLRAYVNIETKIPGKVAPPSTTGVGMTLDLDYRNPTEVKLVKISDDGSRTWEPGRLRR